MHLSETRINRAPAAVSKEQTARGDKIAVETLKQPEHGHDKNQPDRPTGSQSLFECDGGDEPLTKQSLPRSDVCHRGHGEDVKTCADEKRHHNGAKKICRTKSGMGFLRNFRSRFESRHEVRNDLEREKDGNEGGRAKRGMKIGGSSPRGADAKQDDKEKEHHCGRPILKTGAQSNAAIIEQREKNGKGHAQQQARQEYRMSRDAVQFERIQRRKDVRREFADGNRFPRAHDEIRQQHHPASEVTHNRRKYLGGVRRFTRRVR